MRNYSSPSVFAMHIPLAYKLEQLRTKTQPLTLKTCTPNPPTNTAFALLGLLLSLSALPIIAAPVTCTAVAITSATTKTATITFLGSAKGDECGPKRRISVVRVVYIPAERKTGETTMKK